MNCDQGWRLKTDVVDLGRGELMTGDRSPFSVLVVFLVGLRAAKVEGS
jgi:hypothetical protein